MAANISRDIHLQNEAFKQLKIFKDPDYQNFMSDYVSQCKMKEVLYFDHALSDT